ncbi:MAG: hypothetical protein KKA79_05625 [Nanoarchaeota archaeon]|nr:hypothetical protein [Nanoarchaeota archaeon]
MKLPKSFRPEKDLDSKIKDLLSSESLVYDPGAVEDLLDVGEYFLEQELDNYEGFYHVGVGLVKGLKYDLKDVEELSKKIKQGQNKRLGVYLSALINKKITEKDTITLTLEEELNGVGMYLQKGTLIINGNVNNSIGWGMKDGKLIVKGNAYDYTGWCMEGGEVVVKGNANDNTGCYMKGGELVVEGDVNDFTGFDMAGGELVVEGRISSISDLFKKGVIMEGGKTRRDC